MLTIECSVIPKSGDADLCEDGFTTGSHFAAVVDGATDKTGARFDGLTGGRFVMRTITDAIPSLSPDSDAQTAVTALTRAVAASLPEELPADIRPSASVTIYSALRREVWQVGDVGFWFKGLPHQQPRKEVDRINASMRAAVLKAELLRGTTEQELARTDPGRSAILPLLRRQSSFANNPKAGRLAHAVIDGRPVPGKLVTVRQVPDHITEVVLASDGYPAILPTLADAESHLDTLLAQDPLCMGELMGTKGVSPGNTGFDDRTYLRLAVQTT
ncbi:hypothetical protein [Streptomyces sp. NPDC058045]|uniref:hypothetical protein n=1 Tax=Streptomyces sp. NPDC058045 TaxID=3346311 RepID=UPI0036ECD775